MDNAARIRELMLEGHPEASAQLIARLEAENAELNRALEMLRLVNYAMWEREREHMHMHLQTRSCGMTMLHNCMLMQ